MTEKLGNCRLEIDKAATPGKYWVAVWVGEAYISHLSGLKDADELSGIRSWIRNYGHAPELAQPANLARVFR